MKVHQAGYPSVGILGATLSGEQEIIRRAAARAETFVATHSTMAELPPINAEFVAALLAEDEVGSVIRSHLYVEAQLTAFLELTVVEPKFLGNLDLSYAKKVELACCLGFDPKFREALKRIGKLRNDFAHDLSSSLSQQVVSDLYHALPEFCQEAVHSSGRNAASSQIS